MLLSIKDLVGFSLQASDGEIGRINDFYFDDRQWVVRYLIDKMGSWLSGRQVLISPTSINKTDWDQKHFHVSLTRKQVEQSPLLEIEKPLSKDIENDLAAYYDWPVPMRTLGFVGPANTSAGSVYTVLLKDDRQIVTDKEADCPNLQSVAAVLGYKISTDNGEVGAVKDFLIDDKTWAIRYMIIDTKGMNQKMILIAPEWIDWISWKKKRVSVSLVKEKIAACPRFDQVMPISREYENLLYDHYECEKYWEKRDKAE